MNSGQLDLFSGRGSARGDEGRATNASQPETPLRPEMLPDDLLIEKIRDAGMHVAPVLAGEAARRRLHASVPALEALCRRFTGFGRERAIPEQLCALEALAAIGGPSAAEALARLIACGAIGGPGLRTALAAASHLGCSLPNAVVRACLDDKDAVIRASACRFVRPRQDMIGRLLDLLEDRDRDVRVAAACALGRLGRREAKPMLVSLLRTNPTAAVVEAAVPVVDDDVVVLLARIERTCPSLAQAAREALDLTGHPRSQQRPAKAGAHQHIVASGTPHY